MYRHWYSVATGRPSKADTSCTVQRRSAGCGLYLAALRHHISSDLELARVPQYIWPLECCAKARTRRPHSFRALGTSFSQVLQALPSRHETCGKVSVLRFVSACTIRKLRNAP
jgi:hypothetical protein